MIKVGLCLSHELRGTKPLRYMGSKLPTYLKLMELMEAQGWETYVLTRQTYSGDALFKGGWKYTKGKFKITKKRLKMDLVYDRTGGVIFPPDKDNLKVVNPRNFKVFCWDKWAAYGELGEYMPKTFLIEEEKQIKNLIKKIKTDNVVLKPYNGLKGKGIYIGDKKGALKFKFPANYKKYIMQEFVDTSAGLPGVTTGMHDLRVVVAGKVVWCHVRVPPQGKYTANAAQGGALTEVEYKNVPDSVKKVVKRISLKFKKLFGNSIIYSIDFGLDIDGKAKVFEINDQIGFPKYEMKNRDFFLIGLINIFRRKLKSRT